MSSNVVPPARVRGPFRTGPCRRLALWAAAFIPLCLPTAAGAQGPATVGSWGPFFMMPNVAVHAHLLPNGKVLFWGRREINEALDTINTTPHIWDPVTKEFDKPAPPPRPGYDLFCSGHAFLPDGRLLVTGGALFDGDGLKYASLYNPASNQWEAVQDMNAGRWYPTALTLASGEMLVASGSFKTLPLPGAKIGRAQSGVNDLPQILGVDNQWKDLKRLEPLPPPSAGPPLEPFFPLYPFLHVAPDGNVFMSGPLVNSTLFDPSGQKVINKMIPHAAPLVGQRDFGSSIMYDVGKVLVVGGHSHPPTPTAEVIDLNDHDPKWRFVGSLSVPRRQLNATILADGKVLVTGGTDGSGNGDQDFNDLKKPIFTAELWDPDPSSEKWTVMARAAVPRQYHSTAVLLPDATVLTAGGGEYLQAGFLATALDNRRNGQIYFPPYLFNATGLAPRPVISKAPGTAKYGADFTVETPTPAAIKRVTWVRLSSVTHAYNQNQRFNNLAFKATPTGLTVTPPTSGNQAPPGHYLLFLIDGNDVPSVANIIHIDKT
jgi:galactose oxidase